MPVEILDVQRHSPAWKAGLRGGMSLVSIDGREIDDGLDYEFYSAGENLKLLVFADGEEKQIQVKKAEGEALGCEFGSYLISAQRHCRNHCVFCFVDQLPEGLRSSLYFKDDDERLGFLFGNYITLTNLSQRDIQRIIEMRISPINVSVHTVNPQLRVKLMGNKDAGRALEILPKLAEAGIFLNAQLVLCPGLNDGDELRRSLTWLVENLYPALQSVAAVPVGLTKYRQNLYPLRSYTPAEAEAQLDILLEYGEACLKEKGERLIFPSDEWFLLCKRPIPGEDFYDGYPQLENGVGMWRLLQEEFTAALGTLEEQEEPPPPCEADLATGTLAAPLLQNLAKALHASYPQLVLHVHAIQNDFLGHSITVAGLLCGVDIQKQLQGRLYTKHLLLSQNLLRAGQAVFLDDQTPETLAETLHTEVHMIPGDGASLLDAVLACPV